MQSLSIVKSNKQLCTDGSAKEIECAVPKGSCICVLTANEQIQSDLTLFCDSIGMALKLICPAMLAPAGEACDGNIGRARKPSALEALCEDVVNYKLHCDVLVLDADCGLDVVELFNFTLSIKRHLPRLPVVISSLRAKFDTSWSCSLMWDTVISPPYDPNTLINALAAAVSRTLP